MDPKTNQRHSEYLINKRLQLGLLLYTGIVAVVTAAQIYLLMREEVQGVLGFAVDRSGHPAWVGIALLVACEALMFATLWVGLIFSHRIAGPVYRLVKHMEGVTQGTVTGDVAFREGDYFKEAAEACNRMVAELRSAGEKQGE